MYKVHLTMSDLAHREKYPTLPIGWDRGAGSVHAVRFLHMVKHKRHYHRWIRSMINLLSNHVVISLIKDP